MSPGMITILELLISAAIVGGLSYYLSKVE